MGFKSASATSRRAEEAISKTLTSPSQQLKGVPMKSQKFAITAIIVLLLGAFSIPALAQHDDMVTGKKGSFSFDSPVRVGDVLLKRGIYQIQHVMEGEQHVLIFRKMVGTGYAYTSPVASDKVAARVVCRIEPLSEKAKNSGIRFGVNSAGEKTIESLYIQGENVRHVF
jgi:hypothetical protein